MGHIFSVAASATSPMLPAVQQVIQDYEDVFKEPRDLPPKREIKHQIILKPDALPRKQAPYRYSHAFKGEIESIIKEMLDSGIIQNSTSSFASPVLLVKKKDGSWRMCVDYRYLNELSVKHDYPMPIIDELATG